MSASCSAYGLMRRQENGASHRGAIRSAESRARMRQKALGRPRPSAAPAPQAAIHKAVRDVQRGATQRHAAKMAGVSLGALQRALRAMA